MDFGAILVTVAVAVLVGVFISRPFFDRRMESQPLLVRQTAARSEHDLSHWMAEKDHVLTQLMDLDFDFSMGKVNPEEYPAQRAQLLKSGVAVLRKMDELGAVPGATRNQAAPAAQASAGDEIERLIAERRQQMRRPAAGKDALRSASQAAGFCPKCGRAVKKDDQFCPKCGAGLGD